MITIGVALLAQSADTVHVRCRRGARLLYDGPLDMTGAARFVDTLADDEFRAMQRAGYIAYAVCAVGDDGEEGQDTLIAHPTPGIQPA